MSSLARSLFVIGLLFAAGCAASADDDCSDETPEEHAAHTQQDQKNEEASQVKVEETNLDIQKKREALAPKK